MDPVSCRMHLESLLTIGLYIRQDAFQLWLRFLFRPVLSLYLYNVTPQTFALIHFSYVYDEQENLCQLDDKSIFYSGEYGFYNDDRKEVFRDIYRKLSKLYGKPEELDEGFNSYAWKDNGVSLKLLWDTRTNATKLFYQWDEGAEIHDRVVLIAKKINDKEKQKKNEVVFSDSTDGL